MTAAYTNDEQIVKVGSGFELREERSMERMLCGASSFNLVFDWLVILPMQQQGMSSTWCMLSATYMHNLLCHDHASARGSSFVKAALENDEQRVESRINRLDHDGEDILLHCVLLVCCFLC